MRGTSGEIRKFVHQSGSGVILLSIFAAAITAIAIPAFVVEGVCALLAQVFCCNAFSIKI